MDTIPFHFLMVALDLVLCGFLIFWVIFKCRFRCVGGADDLYYAESLPKLRYDESYIRDAFKLSNEKTEQISGRKLLWNLCGVFFGVVVLFMGLVFFAVVFRSNFGQCLVEGLTFHFGAYLLFAAVILFLQGERLVGIFGFLGGVVVLVLGVDMLYIEPTSLVFEHYKITSPKIKFPIRVVFVADIQTDKIDWYERRTLQMIMEAKPDLILLGGDYLQYYSGTSGVSTLPERFRQLFLDIPLSAPLGVYAIAGNIDYSSSEQFSELFMGTTVDPVYFSEMIDGLGEEGNQIDLRFLSVVDSIDGVKQAALSQSGNFTIVVGHYPNYAIQDYQFSEQTPDLMLAGHTHGGQIYIPFYGALRVKYTNREAVISQDFLRGMKHFKNGGNLLITRGSGMERGWAPRVRFMCKPEISVIDIEPQK
jgi:predicted MPP superfamily phosphohydrolase